MKNIYMILVVTMLTISNIVAQTTFTGIITDTNNQPLIGVDIVDINNPKNGTMTDVNGKFIITSNDSEFKITHIGYKQETVTLNENNNNIQLQISVEALSEVVISGSREKQKRTEVPAAISVLNSAKMKEQKAFGIEQMVNTIPGVFMQSSMASSNEQHQMSVRTPISTRALFLYTQDGIPIRPTAVFNHNALLEMNSVSFDRIEVIRGPASSIYGSEAIGGSFNFITKNPTRDLSGSIAYQTNDLGFQRFEAEVSDYAGDKLGFYIGAQFSQRKDGVVDHSDYDKLALTFKMVYHFNESTKWTHMFDIVDYYSDMAGSISEDNFLAGDYESNETFTSREAFAFRYRSTLDKVWNPNNKTSFNFIFRKNNMDQIPSYRTREERVNGVLTGNGSGEINWNEFYSYVGLIQHKINFNFANSSLVAGIHLDYSPQDYVANTIDFDVNLNTNKNENYSVNASDYILNYEADIFNYAGYLQYEISPIEALKVTAALRYDRFTYDYDNRIDGIAGVRDTKTNYDNFAPKVGVNYNFSNTAGVYANVSNGFAPPTTSNLYRNSDSEVGGDVFDLKPSYYYNYEIGGYFNIGNKLKFDVALYDLEGRDVLVSFQNEDQTFDYRNAGKTRSYGLEYGVTFQPTSSLRLFHNGSYAKHRYVEYFEDGVDYSDTDMETAPSLLGNTTLTYKPNFIKNFSVSAQHEYMGEYNTGYENSMPITDENDITTYVTPMYEGYSIFNLRAAYEFKGFELWGQMLNVFDELYSIDAGYSYGRTTYTVGNPRTFHGGIRYTF